MNTFLPTAGFCPITQRDPASCVYVGFRQACAKFRERLYQKTGVRFNQSCRPAPVEIKQGSTSPEPQILPEKETAMAANKVTAGKCAVCCEKKKLIRHLGKEVCSSCMAIRIAAKNKSEWVVAALREFGTFPKGEMAGVNLDDVNETIERLRNKNSGLKEEIAGLEKESTNIKAELEIVKTENASMVQEIARLRASDNGIGSFLSHHLISGGKGITIDIRPIRESA
jgi:hypothetical protein